MWVILCYGDSNTWGYKPGTGDRFSPEKRWPGVLRRELGGGYQVIEEGLSGRTTVWDDPIEGYKNGREYLIPCLESHKPLHLVTLMLGTNDLKKRFSLSAYDIAQGIGALVNLIYKSAAGPEDGAPKVLVITPPPVGKLTEFKEMFEGAESKSEILADHYRRIAEEYGCEFLDASDVIVSSDIDGIHLEEGEHEKLGKAVASRVKKIFERT